jgi:hypothetical protein
MGIELVVLYCIYAISGAVVVNTALDLTGELTMQFSKANTKKYVACQNNPKNDASSCKGLE